MSIWQIFWRDELPYLPAVSLFAGWVLIRMSTAERRVARNTALFLLLCLAAESIGALFQAKGIAGAAILRDGAIVATGLAVIRFAGLALFRGPLPALSFRTPRIAEDGSRGAGEKRAAPARIPSDSSSGLPGQRFLLSQEPLDVLHGGVTSAPDR